MYRLDWFDVRYNRFVIGNKEAIQALFDLFSWQREMGNIKYTHITMSSVDNNEELDRYEGPEWEEQGSVR